jgi:hypothetical protein
MDRIEARMDRIEGQIGRLDGRMDRLEEKMDGSSGGFWGLSWESLERYWDLSASSSWDRRQALKPVEKEIAALRQNPEKRTQFVEALKAYSRSHPDHADLLRQYGISP